MNVAAKKQETLVRPAATLAELSQELAALLPILRGLAEKAALPKLAVDRSFEITSATVRSMIAARHLRDEYFWPAMSESAWAILLELFAGRLEGRRLRLAALSAATDLSIDTALHWIDWIAPRGLVSRKYADGSDAMVDLTDAGADRMRAYLLESLSLSPWVH